MTYRNRLVVLILIGIVVLILALLYIASPVPVSQNKEGGSLNKIVATDKTISVDKYKQHEKDNFQLIEDSVSRLQGEDMVKLDLSGVKNQLMSTKVPKMYQDLHLNLILLVDKIQNREIINSSKLSDNLKSDLGEIIKENPWLK